MSSRRETLHLRLELLRLRGELERAQAASALGELRTGTQRLRRLAAAAGTLARAGDWAGPIAALVGGRPWVATLAVKALRSLRRHPLLALAAGGAVWLLRRRLHEGGDAQPPPATPEAEAAQRDSSGGD
jgi:hypothetical protein